MDIPALLLIPGLIIILGLSAYAALLWLRVWRATRSRKEVAKARDQRLAGDIQILAQGLMEGQVPLIEGAIRIKVLLDNYGGPLSPELDMEVWDTLYAATAHIPTHQAWKDLSRAQRDLHRRQMDTLERNYSQAVETAARQLREALPARLQ